jgi:predicted Zn finger-like uncharacterized protein
MQTTCPECRTTFRVSQDNLGARRGLVRCGTCNAVFNAYDTLLPELESPPAEPAPTRSAPPSTPPATELSTLELSESTVPVSADADSNTATAKLERTPEALVAAAYAAANLPAQAEHIANTLTDIDEAEDEPVVHLSASATLQAPLPAEPEPIKTRVPEPEPDILLQPLSAPKPPRPLTWKTLFSATLATLLVGLFVLQAAYFLRAELAVSVPVTRPALEWLCQALNCSVPLPCQLDQNAIAASSLEHDPEQKSRVRLSFLLTNHTGQTQAWPRIMLTLSDMREAPVAQQVFQPQSYLPKGVNPSAGMPNNSEREIRLDLELGNLVASGYALRLEYP